MRLLMNDLYNGGSFDAFRARVRGILQHPPPEIDAYDLHSLIMIAVQMASPLLDDLRVWAREGFAVAQSVVNGDRNEEVRCAWLMSVTCLISCSYCRSKYRTAKIALTKMIPTVMHLVTVRVSRRVCLFW